MSEPTPRSNKAAATFFLRTGQVGRANQRFDDDLSGYLFSLPMILEADGTLAKDCQHILEALRPA